MFSFFLMNLIKVYQITHKTLSPVPPQHVYVHIMEYWDTTDVCNWLLTLGKGGVKYKELFRKERIDGETLIRLTEDEMKHELGIAELGIRRLLTREIAKKPEIPPTCDDDESLQSLPDITPTDVTPCTLSINEEVELINNITPLTDQSESQIVSSNRPLREIATPAPHAHPKLFIKKTSCSPAPPQRATYSYKTPQQHVNSKSAAAYRLRNLRTPAEVSNVPQRVSLTPVSQILVSKSPSTETTVVLSAPPTRHIPTPTPLSTSRIISSGSVDMISVHPHAARSFGIPKSPPPPDEPSAYSVNGYSPPPLVAEPLSNMHPHLIESGRYVDRKTSELGYQLSNSTSVSLRTLNKSHRSAIPISQSPVTPTNALRSRHVRKVSVDSSSSRAFIDRSNEIETLATVVSKVSRGTETPEFKSQQRDQSAQIDEIISRKVSLVSQDPQDSSSAAAYFEHIEAIGQAVRSRSPKNSFVQRSLLTDGLTEQPRRRFGEPKAKKSQLEHKVEVMDFDDDVPPEPSSQIPIASIHPKTS